MYVWLDALANYITAIGYGSDDPKRHRRVQPLLARRSPPHGQGDHAPPLRLLARLPARRRPAHCPKPITAHGWLLFDNSKMSKSKGNIVRTETILDAFGDHVYAKQFPDSTKQERDLFAADVLRYFLLREIPFGQDGSFSFDALVTRYNADLANGYGNLVSRTLSHDRQVLATAQSKTPRSQLARLLSGTPHRDPKPPGAARSARRLRRPDARLDRAAPRRILQRASAAKPSSATTLAEIAALHHRSSTASSPRQALEARQGLRSLTAAAARDRLYTAAEAIRIITALLHPFCPAATAKVWAPTRPRRHRTGNPTTGELSDSRTGAASSPAQNSAPSPPSSPAPTKDSYRP